MSFIVFTISSLTDSAQERESTANLCVYRRENNAVLKKEQVLEISCRWQNFMVRFSLKRFFVEESAYDIVRGASWDLNVGSPRCKFIFFLYFIDFIFEMIRFNEEIFHH